jgi:hypothetical protein
MRVGDPDIKNRFTYLRSSDAVCRDVFCFDQKATQIHLSDFETFLQKNYPKVDIISKEKSKGDFKMFVLNDIHLQSKYKEGTVSDCGQVAGCCEERWGKPSSGNGAGYWGTKKGNCDIPTRMFVKTLEHVKGIIIFGG